MKAIFVSVILVIVIAIKGQSEATTDWKEYKVIKCYTNRKFGCLILFDSFSQMKHNKNYNETVDGGQQEAMRKQVFLNKDAKIKQHNSGNSTYKLAHNLFSDRV